MICVRSARAEDLSGILQLEAERYAEIDPSAAASREVMLARVKLLNDYPGSPGWFYVAEETDTGKILGDNILMPTSLAPKDCKTWEQATDNGNLVGTFDPDGENVYGISFAVAKDAPEYVAVWLVFHGLHLVAQKTGVLFMCARMPGFAKARTKTGIAAEDYWRARKVNGLPVDWELEIFEELIGAKAVALLPNGYTIDRDSGGHGVLCVSTNPYPQMATLRIYLETEFHQDTSGYKKSIKEQAGILIGGRSQIFDTEVRKFVDTLTLYLPYGCPDWGTKGVLGERLGDRCRFCALPSGPDLFAKLYRSGQATHAAGHIELLQEAWQQAVVTAGVPHTLRLFNGGSALAMRTEVMTTLCELCVKSGVQRLVIEARSQLFDERRLSPMVAMLRKENVRLTIRIGIETQDDHLRDQVLGKGQSRSVIAGAVSVARYLNIDLGGYVLLNPAPGLDPAWAREEALKTISWMLDELGFHEVYLGATCVSPQSPLHEDWKAGRFMPPSPWDVLWVLCQIPESYRYRVHLLPMKDFPPFVAVPSLSKPEGISEFLSGASSEDLAFHALFNRYRTTMSRKDLAKPLGQEPPEWFGRAR